MGCDDDSDCNEHGSCIKETCDCDFGWFGDQCDEKADWGLAWTWFLIFNGVFFFLLLMYVLKHLRAMLYVSIAYDPRPTTRRLLESPKSWLLLSVSIICVLRLLWVAIDPLCFNGITTRLSDRILFESMYPFLYTIYTQVLLLWSGVFQTLIKSRKLLIWRLRRSLCITMLIVFPTAVAIIITRGLRVHDEIWTIVGIVVVVSTLFLLTVSFIVFGLLIINYVKKVRPIPEVKIKDVILDAPETTPLRLNLEEHIKQSKENIETESDENLSQLPTTRHATTFTMSNHEEFSRQPTIKRVSDPVHKSNSFLKRVNTIDRKPKIMVDRAQYQINTQVWDTEESEKNYESWTAEENWTDFESKQNSFVYPTNELKFEKIRSITSTFERSHLFASIVLQPQRNQAYKIELDQSDKRAMCVITTATVFLSLTGFFIILIAMVFMVTDRFFTEEREIIILYVFTACELFSIVVMCRIFTTKITVKSKKALEFMRIYLDRFRRWRP